MIKIAICGNEKKDREAIHELVQAHMDKTGEAYTLKLFGSGRTFLDSGFVPDIVFLDLLDSDESGIEVGIELKRLSRRVLIVYTSFTEGEALLALNRIHAFGILVKPIVKQKLFSMLDDAILYLDKKQGGDLAGDLVTFFSEDGSILQLDITDIYYFEYRNRRIRIVTRNQTYTCRGKIGDIAEKMKEHGFAMSHQSFVVNLYQVAKIERTMLTMKNGDKVDLAQKRASAVRKQLMTTPIKQTMR